MRILLVDDEPELLNVLKKYFHGRGDDVVLASNGEQAWGVIQAASQPFDTLLTDHRMPVMSGIELIKKLRQHGYTLPIVMMSGDGEAHQDKATLKEIVELIAKPMRLSALERVFSTIEANLLTQPPEQTTEQSGSDSPEPNAIAKPDGPASSIDGLANQPTARILVVDDEPEIRTLLCKVLQSEAYHTDQAGDGIEALAKWRSAQLERPFDLLVVDLKMPRMDGATLLAQIRETDPIIPMIVLTGHADLNDSYDLLRKHHISDFLNKPLSHIRKLLFAVRNALEKSQLQRELTTLNTELEQRVQQRTEALQLESQRLKEANEAKTQFLSRMNHELRTPLNAILGFSQLQTRQLDKQMYDKVKRNTAFITQAGSHLLRLVEDVMDLSRLKQNQLPISQECCDLHQVITDSLKLVEQPAFDAQVTLHYSKTKLTVTADEEHLKRVLINLLDNAIKFTGPDHAVTIEVAEVDSGQVEIAVIDAGVGIAIEEQALLFEPFSRLKYADEQQIDGIGVGLAICKLLVELMGGQISVDSTLGQGSRFRVCLPHK